MKRLILLALFAASFAFTVPAAQAKPLRFTGPQEKCWFEKSSQRTPVQYLVRLCGAPRKENIKQFCYWHCTAVRRGSAATCNSACAIPGAVAQPPARGSRPQPAPRKEEETTNRRRRGGASEAYCKTNPYASECRSSEAYCKTNPYADQCRSSEAYCRNNPNSSACRGSEAYCKTNPYAADCQKSEAYCKTNPYADQCRSSEAYCKTNPYDSACRSSEAYCKTNPTDSNCR